MADINVERKGPSIWPWIIGLIVLALLIWALMSLFGGDDNDVVTTQTTEEPVATTEPMPEPMGESSDLLMNPAAHMGESFAGEVQVAEVPTDRGFWIEQDGARLFAILQDQPLEEPLDINPGQTLRIDGGTIMAPTDLEQLGGDPLDEETRQIAEGEPAFLAVDESEIEILAAGEPQPGTDPAETAPGGAI